MRYRIIVLRVQHPIVRDRKLTSPRAGLRSGVATPPARRPRTSAATYGPAVAHRCAGKGMASNDGELRATLEHDTSEKFALETPKSIPNCSPPRLNFLAGIDWPPCQPNNKPCRGPGNNKKPYDRKYNRIHTPPDPPGQKNKNDHCQVLQENTIHNPIVPTS